MYNVFKSKYTYMKNQNVQTGEVIDELVNH